MRFSTADEAILSIPEGARVVFPPASNPWSLLCALGRRPWERDIELVCSAGRLPQEVLDNPRIRILVWQLSAGSRAWVRSGRADYLPLRYSDFRWAFAESSRLRADVLLSEVGPGAHDGVLSPAICSSLLVDILRDVPLALGELNSNAPSSISDPEIRPADFAHLVEAESLPAGARRPSAQPASEAELSAARHVASLVPDGATLQFGVGRVTAAVAAELRGHRHLGIHSGNMTDGHVDLIEAGVVDNSLKEVFPGRSVTGMLVGPRTVALSDRNPDILLASTAVTHGAATLVKFKSFVSINSALEIDLSGQVNAESLEGLQFTGVGGQADYTSGATTRCGPRSASILALTATAEGDRVSRIVSRLHHGAVVTTPRYAVDFVVTEWGVAELRGRPLLERARALIQVADPRFRDSLEASLQTVAI